MLFSNAFMKKFIETLCPSVHSPPQAHDQITEQLQQRIPEPHVYMSSGIIWILYCTTQSCTCQSPKSLLTSYTLVIGRLFLWAQVANPHPHTHICTDHTFIMHHNIKDNLNPLAQVQTTSRHHFWPTHKEISPMFAQSMWCVHVCTVICT